MVEAEQHPLVFYRPMVHFRECSREDMWDEHVTVDTLIKLAVQWMFNGRSTHGFPFERPWKMTPALLKRL